MFARRTLSVFIAMIVLSSLLPLGKVSTAQSGVQGGVYQGPYLKVSSDNDTKWSPAVAYNTTHDQFLVVWETWWPFTIAGHHAIYGRLVNGSNQFLGSQFLIYSGSNNSLQPSVAYDPDNDRYLVVWSYDSAGDGTDMDIYGRFIPWNGPSAAELAFGIEASRSNSDKPKVVYGLTPHALLVIWRNLPVSPDPNYSITGGMYNTLSKTWSSAFIITIGAQARDFPALTYNLSANQFVVSWDQDMSGPSNPNDLDIRAARLSGAGGVLSTDISITFSFDREEHPAVAACYNTNQVLFVWEWDTVVNSNPDVLLYGRVMDQSGNLGDITFVVGTTLPKQLPNLSCNSDGTQYFLAWSDQYGGDAYPHWGVWATTINPNATNPFFTMGSMIQVIAPCFPPDTNCDNLFPAISYGKDKALIVWQAGRMNTSYRDIWGQLEWTKYYNAFLPDLVR